MRHCRALVKILLSRFRSPEIRSADKVFFVCHMSNPSKYSGLAGTVLLGTLLGLNYTQYAKRKSPLADKAISFDPSSENSTSFYDEHGAPVPLGKTNIPGMDAVRRIREQVPENSPLLLCAVLSGLWAIRSFGAMNKVLNRRYSDVVYQIRRPDIIANRLVAWRIIGLGGLVVPVCLGAYGYHVVRSGTVSEETSGILRDSFSPLVREIHQFGGLSSLRIERTHLADSVAEFSRTLRDGFKP